MRYLSFLWFNIFCMVCCLISTAQNRQIGISISPDFSHHYTKYEDLPIRVHENESAKFGYKAGFNFLFRLKGEKWIANTGLIYANRGYQSKKIDIQNILNEPKIARSQRYRYHFHYVDVSLQARYYAIEKESIKGFVALSAIPAFMFRETMTHIYYFSDNTDRVRNGSFPNRFFNVFTELSAGVEYSLKVKYRLLLEPNFQYGWISLQNESFVTRLWSLGIKTGLYMNL